MSISEIASYPAGLLVQAFYHGAAVVDLPLLPAILHVESYWHWAVMFISALTKTDIGRFDCKNKKRSPPPHIFTEAGMTTVL